MSPAPAALRQRGGAADPAVRKSLSPGTRFALSPSWRFQHRLHGLIHTGRRLVPNCNPGWDERPVFVGSPKRGQLVIDEKWGDNPDQKTMSPYKVRDDHLNKWIEFLRHCGGFEVWCIRGEQPSKTANMEP